MAQVKEQTLFQRQSPKLQARITGICKNWSKKGYGFIIRDDGEGDVFVHHTQLKKNGYRSLLVGEIVEFDIRASKNGRKQAVRVTGPGGIDVLGIGHLGTTETSPMTFKYNNPKREPYGTQPYTNDPRYHFQLATPDRSRSEIFPSPERSRSEIFPSFQVYGLFQE